MEIMCGRFTLRARLNRVVQEMDLFGHLDWAPRYNIAPTQEVAIVRANPDGRRRSPRFAGAWFHRGRRMRSRPAL